MRTDVSRRTERAVESVTRRSLSGRHPRCGGCPQGRALRTCSNGSPHCLTPTARPGREVVTGVPRAWTAATIPSRTEHGRSVSPAHDEAGEGRRHGAHRAVPEALRPHGCCLVLRALGGRRGDSEHAEHPRLTISEVAALQQTVEHLADAPGELPRARTRGTS